MNNGYISFTPQPWGQTYSIREISAPSGYLINDQIEEFEIKTGDAELLFSFVNEREPCDIQVIKLDGTDRTPLEGVEFGLYSEAGELLDTGFTQADGKIMFEDIPWGAQYQIRELSPLTGYLPLSPIDVTVHRGDKLIELETVNERRR